MTNYLKTALKVILPFVGLSLFIYSKVQLTGGLPVEEVFFILSSFALLIVALFLVAFMRRTNLHLDYRGFLRDIGYFVFGVFGLITGLLTNVYAAATLLPVFGLNNPVNPITNNLPLQLLGIALSGVFYVMTIFIFVFAIESLLFAFGYHSPMIRKK